MRGVRNTSLSVTCQKGFVFSRLQRHPHLGSQDQCAACGRQHHARQQAAATTCFWAVFLGPTLSNGISALATAELARPGFLPTHLDAVYQAAPGHC